MKAMKLVIAGIVTVALAIALPLMVGQAGASVHQVTVSNRSSELRPAELRQTETSFRTERLAAGSYDTCAIRQGGRVLCWGLNDEGRLGIARNAGQERCTDGDVCAVIPMRVLGVTGATEISAGSAFTCVLLKGGAVKCWGVTNNGELGHGGVGIRNVSPPEPVLGIQDAVQVSAGTDHACALLRSGHVMCWGDNFTGELGDGKTGGSRDRPVAVPGLNDAVQVSAGYYDTCAVLLGGSVDCWGDGLDGDLGDGSTSWMVDRPEPVSGISSAVQVTAGDQHTCALLSTGKVVCWGYNGLGELGDGISRGPARCDSDPCSTVPVQVHGIGHVTQITAQSSGETCAILANRHVECWGWNADGQLGDGTSSGPETCTDSNGQRQACSVTPVMVHDVANVTGIAVSNHVCALLASGTVKCWGWNADGALGDGSFTGPAKCDGGAESGCVTEPVRVHGL